MPIIDIVLIIILAGFVFYGLFFGLIRTIGSLAGLILGVWLATLLYIPVFNWAQNLFFGFNNSGKIITFFILYTLVNRLVVFAFAMLDKTFDFISIIPFLKTINRLAGAIFGFFEGSLILGLILYVATSQPFIGTWNLWASSKIAPYLVKFIMTLKPLIPGILSKLQALI